MTNPDTFDGSPTTSFNTWWRSVTKYLEFYPETGDRQKIAWVGTLLTGTAKAWDLHRYDTLGEADTWFNYSAAIRAEYLDSREAAGAQQKLGQLKYTGNIQAYFTEFLALNRYARSTGEGLQEKINLAMTSEILRMRFAHYRGNFVDDNDFMTATYEAGLQVEEMKALEKTRDAARNHRTDDKKKEERKKDEKWAPIPQQAREPRRNEAKTQRTEGWGTTGAALQGVPQNEIEAHKKTCDGCWRCGRTGHRTHDCYSFQTIQGTELPPAKWKVAAVNQPAQEPATGKRKREDNEGNATAKQQKVAAVEEMILEPLAWADAEDSDF